MKSELSVGMDPHVQIDMRRGNAGSGVAVPEIPVKAQRHALWLHCGHLAGALRCEPVSNEVGPLSVSNRG